MTVTSGLQAGLDLLEDVHEEGSNYRAQCPSCGSRTLWITPQSDGAVVYHCKGTCAQEDVTAALRALGINFPTSRERYVYVDENGDTLFVKRSFRKPGERKKRPWYQCLSRNGVPVSHNSKRKGTWSAKGCTMCGRKKLPPTLYHLDEVRRAVENGDEIWLCEGEKDADAVRDTGAVATSSMNGASDWNPEYVRQLSGARTIIVVGDDDDAGRTGALNRYLSLTGDGRTVRVVFPKQGKDAYDHRAYGHSLNDFVEADIGELKAQAQIANGDAADLSDPLPGEEMTHIGYRNRLVALHGEELLHSPKQWYLWNGTNWEPDELQVALSCTADLARTLTRIHAELARNATDDGKKAAESLRRRALEMESTSNLIATLRLAEVALACRTADIDPDPTLLVCNTGIYKGNGVFAPHDASLRYSKCIDLEHDPEAACPEWDEFVASSIRDSDSVRYLQTLIGFALCGGDRKKKRVVNLIGPKDTGKSTLLRVLGDLLEPYVSTPAVEELVAGGRRANSDKFALNELRGARIASISETEARSSFRLAALKALTGGDMIQTQGKGTRPVQWRASVMLLIATNERIVFDVTDKAFTDRLVPIEFKRRRTIDRSLDRKLEAERPGILNWVLAGVDSYLRDEMAEPKSIIRARTTAETEVSTTYQFLVDALDRGRIREVGSAFPVMRCCKLTELHKLYKSWCKATGVRPIGQREFTRTVSVRFPVTEKIQGDGVKHHLGIAMSRRRAEGG